MILFRFENVFEDNTSAKRRKGESREGGSGEKERRNSWNEIDAYVVRHL